jgi:hypothetical protein
MELRSHALLILSFIASLLLGREEAAVVVIAAPVPGKERKSRRRFKFEITALCIAGPDEHLL